MRHSVLLFIVTALTGCATPELEGTKWACETSADCGEGYLCNESTRSCQRADTGGVNGIFNDRLVVGMTGPITTGPTALGQGVKAGIEAYFSAVNAAGGVHGRRLELTARDDGGEGDKALENAKAFIDSRSVLAMVGNVGDVAAHAITPYAVDNRALQFGAVAGTSLLRKDPPDRYVFSVRASVAEELRRLVVFFTQNRAPQIPATNLAVFAQGEDSQGGADVYGQEAIDAVKAVLKEKHNLTALTQATHTRGTIETKPAVTHLLKWLGSGELAKDQNQQVSAVVLLATTYRPASLLIKELLEEVFRIKRETSSGEDYGLSPEEAAEIAAVRDILFAAPSLVGSGSLAQELQAFGSYDTDTRGGKRSFCSGVILSQVLPSFEAAASGIIEYRDDLQAYDSNLVPGYFSFEGYVAARAFVEALERHGRALSVESFIDTIEGLGELNLGLGTPLKLTVDDHQALDRVWGTLLDETCALQELDLGDDTGITPPTPSTGCEGDTCVLTGTITESLTLTADKTWLLRGTVFIGDDHNETVLTIDPGTTVIGEKSTVGTLVIRRGSKIKAVGTPELPIVLTSDQPEGKRARGDWGGVILNGRATINACVGETGTCEAFGEGGTGFYGGDDDEDDSGWMEYVRIEFAGALFSPENELNGLALQGVGSKTKLNHIQSHMGQDDGVEFFGGTANIKHLVITGAGDDSLDWTEGWRGKAQFVVVQQYEDGGDNGIEADNNGDDNAAAPRSKPTLYNLTLIGSPQSDSSDLGMLLREGTGANICNAIVTAFNEACLDIDHAETFTNAYDQGQLTGQLTLSSSIVSCAMSFKEDPTDPFLVSEFFTTYNTGNQVTDPKLEAPTNAATLDVGPAAGSPALSGACPDSTDPFFQKVTYIGAVGPDDDWLAGWTTTARN